MNPTNAKQPDAPRNFLFLAAEGCHTDCGPECDHKKFVTVARCMMKDGYVYYAHLGQGAMEDDAFGVRHLPLDRTSLPHFGDLHAVLVLNDHDLFELARMQYVDAQVHLIESSAVGGVVGEDDASSDVPLVAAA
jgi:hypothetical protein